MTEPGAIRALFLDVGGVLLTNAWDEEALQRAAREFDLDLDELRARHTLVHGTYELGKISLADYLRHVVFHTPRTFSLEDFAAFMRAQSEIVPGMIELFAGLKRQYGLKVVMVSNEGRELMDHRKVQFRLDELADVFVVSCHLHLRKPDPDFYHAALDIAQVQASQAVYVDDRALLVEVAREIGFRGIQHTSLASTRTALAGLGLVA
ncbi:MAG: HAD family phosphatase [Chloroflexi bacterium]|nr:HAD family phosphatase [Chloroflexota bacterium]